jgi:hypothetical protein
MLDGAGITAGGEGDAETRQWCMVVVAVHCTLNLTLWSQLELHIKRNGHGLRQSCSME